MRGESKVPEWTAYLDVPVTGLDAAMKGLQRDAIDTSVDLERFLRGIRAAPSADLQASCLQLSSVMAVIVMELGLTRRALVREVGR